MPNGNDQQVIVINRALNVEAEEPLPVTAPSPLPVNGSVSASVTSYPPQRYEYRIFNTLNEPPFIRVPTLGIRPGQAVPQDFVIRSLEVWFSEGFEIHFAGSVSFAALTTVFVLRRPIG